ncbi:MAG: B12-binding domain-containing radical SAM protein [Steroidobacteraceae bacterium]
MSPSPPKVLALIPPMTQLNTPYPATAYLSGFLRHRQVPAAQADLALELVLAIMSKAGIEALTEAVQQRSAKRRTQAERAFLASCDLYSTTIEPVIAFLQGRDATLAHRIASRRYLPEGPRFSVLAAYEGDDPLAWAFGALGTQDRARHLATLYLNDIADVIRDAIDSGFEFVRYGEKLAASQSDFGFLERALARPPHLLDRYLEQLTRQVLKTQTPDLVLLSVPFPGALYGALRIAQTVRSLRPHATIVMGGGYVNTELRELTEPRLFDFVDYVTLDRGEAPLWAIIEVLQGERKPTELIRTFIRTKEGEVRYVDAGDLEIPFTDTGTPTWQGLPLDRYLSLLDMLNPMHRLWSEGRWNKLTVAHGCYWKKCSFCDVSLDYISNYQTASAAVLVDRIETIVAETRETGFHFVDEAAPPKVLKALAAELLRRQTTISWWGNIRFEKTFTLALCEELAASGCIAVSGGLEVASDRLLRLMKKGVSVAQVARVTRSFTDAGILVHAYLMYGFPTQTVAETIDSLEYVRQLFAEGCLQSGYFHRFTCTVHSPVGLNPAEYGVSLIPPPPGRFARNDIGFHDPTGVDHDVLGKALSTALYNYMHGVAIDRPVRDWFAEVMPDLRLPRTRVPANYIARALAGEIE